jgi:PAS domain S-box-containing protein
MTLPAEPGRPDRRDDALESPWRQLLEAAQQAYVAVSADRRVADCNRGAQELFGLSRDQLVGREVTRLVAGPDRDGLVAGLDLRVRRGQSAELAPLELTALHADGSSFDAECTVWGVERRGAQAVHAFFRDVSGQRREAEAVSLLAAVVEGSSDAILTCALDGTVLTWNAAAERMYGWTAVEVVGRNGALIIPERERPALAQMLDEVGRGRRAPGYEGELLTRGGTGVPVSLRISPVRDAGSRVVAASVVARDLTEQRWMAETLDASIAALQRAADEAIESAAVTQRFLADAAHQLRTPVAGIRACAETLLRGAGPSDADRLLTTLVRETSRAGRLIAGLLAIARLDQGAPAPVEPVDVAALCAEEVERLALLAPGLDVRLVVERAPAGPLMLAPGGCREILSNLGDNALRHAASSITLVVDCGEQLRLRVDDDGPGVPVEQQRQVFERFVSLDAGGGSGLGLPIARAHARALGGDLHYDAGFVVRLPALPADDQPTAD